MKMKKIILPLVTFLTASLFAGSTSPSLYPVTQWYNPEPGVPVETGVQLKGVVYVKPGGQGDGSTWAKACGDIQKAINTASSKAGDDGFAEVWIAAGTYKHGSTIFLKKNVGVFGGFAGDETEWTANENKRQEYVNGECTGKYLTPIGRATRKCGNFVYIDGEGKYAVFVAQGKGKPMEDRAMLGTLIIQNGHSSNALAGGGALYVRSFYLTISNCTFRNNTSIFSGGAIYNHDELYDLKTPTNDDEFSAEVHHNHLELFNCTFVNNVASYNGGAICNGETVYNPDFSDPNDGILDNSGSSGTQEEPDSSMILRNCTFTQNKAMRGGAIFDNAGSVIVNSILWGNIATKRAGEVYNESNSQIIHTCVIKQRREIGKLLYMEGIYTDPSLEQPSENGREPERLYSHEYIITKDPKLLPLADNGGNVLTCALGAKSSAIKAGVLSEEALTDARGVVRPVSVDGSIVKSTIGAVEYSTVKFSKNPSTTVRTFVGGAVEISVDYDTKLESQIEYEWYMYDGKKWLPIPNTKGELAPFNTDVLDDDEYNGGVFKPIEPLKISNVTKEHSLYRYKCVLTDKRHNKTIESNVVKVAVVDKPTIEITENNRATKLAVYDPTDIVDGVAKVDSRITICLQVKAKGVKNLTYQWQYKYQNENDSAWKNISKTENKTANSVKFIADCVDADDFNKEYRLVVNSTYLQSLEDVVSNVYKPVKLAKAGIANVNLPADCTCSNTEKATFTVEATPSDDKNLKFQWQVSTDGVIWKNVGAKQTLVISKPDVKLSGNQYRCLVSNKGNPKNPEVSRIATLTVRAGAKITKAQLVSKTTIYKGDFVSASVEAKGYNTKYQWQYSLDGKNWVNIAGETSNILNAFDTSSLTMPKGKTSTSVQCRCLAWSEDSGTMIGLKVVSKTLKVTLKDCVAFNGYSFKRSGEELTDITSTSNSIEGIDSTNGTSVYVFAEYPFEMSVLASGDKPRYQWQYSSDGVTWENIAKATKKSYILKPLDTSDSGYYRCYISNGGSDILGGTFELIAMDCPVKATLSGCLATGYFDFDGINGFFDAVFVDKKNFRICLDNGVVLENSTYSIKRTSPTEATLTMAFKYNGVSYSMKGSFEYDSQTTTWVALLKDQKKGVDLKFRVDSMEYADFEDDSIPAQSKDLVANEIEFNGVKVIFKTTKKCDLILSTASVQDCTYSYKNYKNGISTITIKGKNADTTYNCELVLFEFEEGIYKLETKDNKNQRKVVVGKLN